MVAPNFKVRSWVRSRTYLYRLAAHRPAGPGLERLHLHLRPQEEEEEEEEEVSSGGNSAKRRARRRARLRWELRRAQRVGRLPAHLGGTWAEFW